MAESELEFLRGVELRLLRCTFSSPSSQSSPFEANSSLKSAVDSVVKAIERGNYEDALCSEVVLRVFPFAESWVLVDSVDAAEGFYEKVDCCVREFLREDDEDGEDTGCKMALVLSLSVAALLGFVQNNMTGPIEDYCPFPLQINGCSKNKAQQDGQWGVWARNQLMLEGSEVLGKLSLVQYIIYARILLNNIKAIHADGFHTHKIGAGTVSWWLCRLTFALQRILDNLSSSLYSSLQDLVGDTLCRFGSLESVNLYWSSQLYENEASTIVSMAYLEAGIIEHAYGHVDSSELHLNDAKKACGLHLSLTGVLGFRTIHQVDAKSQLVLVAETEQKGSSGGSWDKISTGPDNEASQSPANSDECDILIAPRRLENNSDIKVNGNSSLLSDQTVLTEPQKAIVLAQCLHVKKKNPDNEMTGWEMAPFIEAIDSQHCTCFIIQCLSDILRVRWESSRSRTKQRALLMMDKLVGRVCGPSPSATERIRCSFSVYIPTIPSLRKEYGRLLVSNGLIGEALKTFEELELWDDLIYCYRLLEKKSAAVDLIRARLTEMPEDPRLWCSLGDVANDDAHFHKALEVSNNRSVRAKRSLARSAYNRGDFETSKILWESAMAVNPLFPDGWFALGAAALKARDLDKAVEAFTHAVQVDPDNGEAWNNIACIHKMKKRSKESFVAFKEALKFRRNSWQLWENYSHVAYDIGNIAQALEAIKRTLDLSDNKRVDVDLLEKIVVSVEDIASVPRDNLDLRSDEPGSREQEGSREAEFLIGLLGNVLQQIIKKGNSNNVWGLYARWHKIKGDLRMCAEALLKQVRSYQGSELWRDKDRFKKFASASLRLCRVYMEIASSTGERRELFTAEMHLKNTVKQGVDFAETQEYKDLEICLQEVRSRMAEH